MENSTFTYNGHTYLLSDALTWQEAQNQAVSMGGNLVTINDAAEQAWLAATFVTSSWIGYTDQVTAGTFQWISGETATYTNWNADEPNNSGGNEHYAQQYSNGLWNDIAGDTQIAGIIEINSIANNAPTLTLFSEPVNTGTENSVVTVGFADLQAKGDEADTDGTVDAFVVKAVSSGVLNIGLSAATATPWDALTNNTVDAAHQGYWTPDSNANGTLNAFTVVAKDNGGLESAVPVQATIDITAPIIPPPSQNHAPILTAPDAIHYTDTAFADNFAPVVGSLVAGDADNDSLTYGIVGGTGIDYISMSNAYGILTVTKATGAYGFIPDSAAMEALSVDAAGTFTVTVSDSQLTDSKTLVIDIVQSSVTESVGNDKLMSTADNDVFNGLAGYLYTVGDAVKEYAHQGIDTAPFVSGADTYVFQDGGAVDTLVELVGVTAHSLNTAGL